MIGIVPETTCPSDGLFMETLTPLLTFGFAVCDALFATLTIHDALPITFPPEKTLTSSVCAPFGVRVVSHLKTLFPPATGGAYVLLVTTLPSSETSTLDIVS
jgi:hypothetical protein